MILNLKGLEDCTRNPFNLIKTFGKVSGYKINIQKSVAFLYANNKHAEKEIRKMITFMIVSKIPRSKINQVGKRHI
jgi:uncharacterized protein YlbG (UPF0298 family)